MNGKLVGEKTKDDLSNAVTRSPCWRPTTRTAVESAYLAVLTRRPTPEEADHFEASLEGTTGKERKRPPGRPLLGPASIPRSSHGTIELTRAAWDSCAAAISPRWAGLGGWLADAAGPAAGRGRAEQVAANRRSRSSCSGWPAGPASSKPSIPHPGNAIAGGTRRSTPRSKGIQLAEGFEQLAEQMGSIALIRSLVSKEGDHERGTYIVKTGYRPDPTVVHPVDRRRLLPRIARRQDRYPAARLDPAGPWPAAAASSATSTTPSRSTIPTGSCPT